MWDDVLGGSVCGGRSNSSCLPEKPLLIFGVNGLLTKHFVLLWGVYSETVQVSAKHGYAGDLGRY